MCFAKLAWVHETGHRSFGLFVTLAATATTGLLVAAAYFTRTYLLATLIGVGFGVLLSPIMGLLQRYLKLPRPLSAVLLLVLILSGVSGIGYALFRLLADQTTRLVSQAPQLEATARMHLDNLLARAPWIATRLQRINIEQTIRAALETVLQGLQTSFTAIAGAAIVLIIAIYVATNADEYFRGLLSLFPAYLRPRAREVFRSSGAVLRKWFKNQLLVMSISGALTTIALWALGIDYWLLLGALTGIFGFIPYIGVAITGLATTIVTLGSNPDQFWWVLGVYIAIQQIEGDVTIPLIMRGGVQLPEVHVLVFMLLMGVLFGVPGVFIAPPLLAVIRNIYLITYVPYMDQRTAGPADGSRNDERRSVARRSA